MPSFKKLIKSVSLMLLIHFLFAFYRLIPVVENFQPRTFILPMGELIIIYLIINGKNWRRIRALTSLLIIAFLVFFLSGEIFYRIFYLERFNMISDMRLIPNFLVMLLPEDILPSGIIKAAAVIITIAVTFTIAFAVLSVLQKHSQVMSYEMKKPVKIVLTAAALILMLLFPVGSPLMQTVGITGFSERAVNQLEKTNRREIVSRQESVFKDLSETALKARVPEWTSSGISDSDIHFAVIESYGAVLFQRPEYTEFILDAYKRLQPLLTEDGWTVRSGYVISPAFGGRSWLADATLLSGQQIGNQRIYDERVRLGEPAFLLTIMKQAGYISYYVAPGATQASEEWRKAYPFDQYLLRSDFDYEGPNVAFGTMTDQYVFDFFSRNVLREDQKEFSFYLLVSSHTPFERIPIYKPDWDFGLKGREYENGLIKFFENNWLYGNELAEGYLEGISYSLETTVHYLTDILSEKQFMLIVGDHQPRKPVSGPDPGCPVPFHIIVPSAIPLTFPPDWNLSYGLIPPELPGNYNDLPEMAALPFLVEQLVK